MNKFQNILARQSLALFASILILLNSLLVACGPNQSLPQLMKSSLMGDVSDDGSGSDDSGGDDGSGSDDSGDDDSGGDEEGPGTVREPEPSKPSKDGDSDSKKSDTSKDVSTGDRVGGGFERTHAKVKLDDGSEEHVFSEPSVDSDNKGRDTRQDKDAERSVGSDKSISISEDAGDAVGNRTDTMPEGSPAVGNGEGMGSGSGRGGKGNEGGSGGGAGPGGSPKDKETKKFPDLPALIGANGVADTNTDAIIRGANALFDGSGPDLNKQIGLGVTSHNNTVAAVFVGVALVAMPAISIPAWAIAGAAAAAVAAIIANSTIDWGQIGNLLGGSIDRNVPELNDLEGHTHFSESDQPNAPDTDGDGKPDVEKNPDGTPKITKHAEEQMKDRGVTPAAVDDALKNPLHVTPVKIDPKTKNPSQQYIGKDATVARNPETGAIATTWKTGTTNRKKYEKTGNRGN